MLTWIYNTREQLHHHHHDTCHHVWCIYLRSCKGCVSFPITFLFHRSSKRQQARSTVAAADVIWKVIGVPEESLFTKGHCLRVPDIHPCCTYRHDFIWQGLNFFCLKADELIWSTWCLRQLGLHTRCVNSRSKVAQPTKYPRPGTLCTIFSNTSLLFYFFLSFIYQAKG